MLDSNRLCNLIFPRLVLAICIWEIALEYEQQMQQICRGWWSNLLSAVLTCERLLALMDVPGDLLKQPNYNSEWTTCRSPCRERCGLNMRRNYIPHYRCCMWHILLVWVATVLHILHPYSYRYNRLYTPCANRVGPMTSHFIIHPRRCETVNTRLQVRRRRALGLWLIGRDLQTHPQTANSGLCNGWNLLDAANTDPGSLGRSSRSFTQHRQLAREGRRCA